MKTLKTLSVLICILSFNASVMAQGLVTLTVQGFGSSNEVLVAANQQVTLKTWLDSDFHSLGLGASSRLTIVKDGKTFELKPDVNFTPPNGGQSFVIPSPVIITGPATVRLYCWGNAQSKALATLEVTPSQYPPDKAVTIGPYSGVLKVTMETSKNLVDWIPADNGAIYTNSPDARFFRITIDKNAPPGQ